ncbi:hypothetical protein [Pseudochrobactrum asaccharolyticum]|uniref:hypothetical protein n=1 Tax=Pseudochrobactrum asaccharolyticum TaxID=354351 RepID=UPI004044D0E7
MAVFPRSICKFRSNGEAWNQLISYVCSNSGLAPIFVCNLYVEGSFFSCFELSTTPDSPIAAP